MTSTEQERQELADRLRRCANDIRSLGYYVPYEMGEFGLAYLAVLGAESIIRGR